MTSNDLLYKSLLSQVGSHDSVSGVTYSGENWSSTVYISGVITGFTQV